MSETKRAAMIALLDEMHNAAVNIGRAAMGADVGRLKVATDVYYEKYKLVLEEVYK